MTTRILPISTPLPDDQFLQDNVLCEATLTKLLSVVADKQSFLLHFSWDDVRTVMKIVAVLKGYLVELTLTQADLTANKVNNTLYIGININGSGNVEISQPIHISSSSAATYLKVANKIESSWFAEPEAYYRIEPRSIDVRDVIINCGTATT